MLSPDALLAELAAAGFPQWCAVLQNAVTERLRSGVHGQLAAWDQVLQRLPPIDTDRPVLDEPVLRAGGRETAAQTDALRELLLELSPWRKGPFNVCGVDIDSEWRSDLKWSRVLPAISPLEGRLVLDVGCGNGYYALRMRGEGAAFVLGIDPTLLYLAQFRAMQRYFREPSVQVLPLRLTDLPRGHFAFDTAFSMGVLYHQREPLQHLQELHAVLRPGGELVLETLILPGDELRASTPPDRYARMRNVWLLPTLPQLLNWLADCGFSNSRVADVSVTTVAEQRPTEWMRFESLQQALDPDNPELTVEGWPRPRRAVLVSRAVA